MDKIYRLRPANDKTLEELTEHYLWFSRPTEYKDFEDANVVAFSKNNETIKDLFDRVFGDAEMLGTELSRLGICCFTKLLPKVSEWSKFPKGYNSIFIEYDKNLIEEYFLNKYYLGGCFKEVKYDKHPLDLKSSGNGNYDILWEDNKKEGFKIYKSLRGDIARDEKLMDEFILRSLTTINNKYKKQNEIRIILPYRAVKDESEESLGYKIVIPKESIIKIYYSENTNANFVKTLNEMGFLTKKLKKCTFYNSFLQKIRK